MCVWALQQWPAYAMYFLCLLHSLQSQRQQSDRAEQAYQRVAARLREMQAVATDMSGTKMLTALQEDVDRLRTQVSHVDAAVDRILLCTHSCWYMLVYAATCTYVASLS